MPTGGPGRVFDTGLQQSMATREPNLEPRRETMCLLSSVSLETNLRYDHSLTEHDLPQSHGG